MANNLAAGGISCRAPPACADPTRRRNIGEGTWVDRGARKLTNVANPDIPISNGGTNGYQL
jgi:hypothetical protein